MNKQNIIFIFRKVNKDYFELDEHTKNIYNKIFILSLNITITEKILFINLNDLIKYLNNLTEYKYIIIFYEKCKRSLPNETKCSEMRVSAHSDFVKMLNDIKENPELLEIFDEQCLIWFNNKNLIDIIKDIIDKYFDKSSNTYNISIQFKMNLQNLIDKPKELLELINDCLKPKESEKKQFGEVFTPIKLVNEMLDKLPKEVWKNKDLKWLDPAVGMGNFPVIIYLKLMETLKDIIIDEKERKKHIIENMLYMCELNKKNVLICKQIFNFNNEYNMNIYEGDSLELNYLDYFCINKFDIIVGNPPYQQINDNGCSKGGGNNLYTKFIYKGYDLLTNNGYFVFINPPTYFGIGRSNNKDDMNIRKDIFNNCYMLYINLEECNKYFPNIGSLFIYYIFQKIKKINNKLEIICKYNNKIYSSIINQELLNNMVYIPYLLTNTSINICKKIKDTENKLKIFHSPDNRGDKKHVKKNKDDEFKYPIQATGVQILYSSKPCKNQCNKKVLMSRSGYLRPFYDDGKLGIGGDCFCCLVENKDEADNIIKLLESKLYTFYININKWSGFHHLSVLQDIPNIQIENINDNYIYKYFNLNEEEINLVENVISKSKEESNIEYQIIKYNKKNYYLIDNKLYYINKNKSKGDLFANYNNGNIE